MFEFAGDFDRACDAAVKMGDWRRVVQLDGSPVRRKTRAVLETLLEQGRFDEAVRIAETFLNDKNVAIDAAIQGNLWLDAFRISSCADKDITPHAFTNWNHIVITTGTGINASDLDIGRLDATYFNGKIDDVKIYNYTLTAEQVKIDYNQGAALRFGD